MNYVLYTYIHNYVKPCTLYTGHTVKSHNPKLCVLTHMLCDTVCNECKVADTSNNVRVRWNGNLSSFYFIKCTFHSRHNGYRSLWYGTYYIYYMYINSNVSVEPCTLCQVAQFYE